MSPSPSITAETMVKDTPAQAGTANAHGKHYPHCTCETCNPPIPKATDSEPKQFGPPGWEPEDDVEELPLRSELWDLRYAEDDSGKMGYPIGWWDKPEEERLPQEISSEEKFRRARARWDGRFEPEESSPSLVVDSDVEESEQDPVVEPDDEESRKDPVVEPDDEESKKDPVVEQDDEKLKKASVVEPNDEESKKDTPAQTETADANWNKYPYCDCRICDDNRAREPKRFGPPGWEPEEDVEELPTRMTILNYRYPADDSGVMGHPIGWFDPVIEHRKRCEAREAIRLKKEEERRAKKPPGAPDTPEPGYERVIREARERRAQWNGIHFELEDPTPCPVVETDDEDVPELSLSLDDPSKRIQGCSQQSDEDVKATTVLEDSLQNKPKQQTSKSSPTRSSDTDATDKKTSISQNPESHQKEKYPNTTKETSGGFGRPSGRSGNPSSGFGHPSGGFGKPSSDSGEEVVLKLLPIDAPIFSLLNVGEPGYLSEDTDCYDFTPFEGPNRSKNRSPKTRSGGSDHHNGQYRGPLSARGQHDDHSQSESDSGSDSDFPSWAAEYRRKARRASSKQQYSSKSKTQKADSQPAEFEVQSDPMWHRRSRDKPFVEALKPENDRLKSTEIFDNDPEPKDLKPNSANTPATKRREVSLSTDGDGGAFHHYYSAGEPDNCESASKARAAPKIVVSNVAGPSGSDANITVSNVAGPSGNDANITITVRFEMDPKLRVITDHVCASSCPLNPRAHTCEGISGENTATLAPEATKAREGKLRRAFNRIKGFFKSTAKTVKVA